VWDKSYIELKIAREPKDVFQTEVKHPKSLMNYLGLTLEEARPAEGHRELPLRHRLRERRRLIVARANELPTQDLHAGAAALDEDIPRVSEDHGAHPLKNWGGHA